MLFTVNDWHVRHCLDEEWELNMLNNRVTLKGNLTRDPEYKTVSEKNLVSFRIAVNESVGNGKEETVYMDVDGWGSHA